ARGKCPERSAPRGPCHPRSRGTRDCRPRRRCPTWGCQGREQRVYCRGGSAARRRRGGAGFYSTRIGTCRSCSFLSEPLGADHTLANKNCCQEPTVEGKVGGCREGLANLGRLVDREAFHAHGFERWARALAHRHLPRIELAPLSAHGHEHQAGCP